MVKKIESLTKKQEERLPEFRDKWIELGLSTEPIDHALAEHALRGAYSVVGIEPPKLIIWMNNPFDAVMARGIILTWILEGVLQGKINLPGVGIKPGAQVRDQVSAQVSAQVRDQVSDQVSDQVIDQVIDQKLDPRFFWIYWYEGLGNQEWWLSWIDYFANCTDARIDQKICPVMDLAYAAHWYFPMLGITIMCERPLSIRRDHRNRLHNDEGPAVAYNGWNVYAVNGIRVPAWIVEDKESITPELIDAEDNAEIRRIMMEFYGWDRYLQVVKAKLIDRDEDPIIGELWSFKDKDGVTVNIHRMQNGTPAGYDAHTGEPIAKWYADRVRPEIKTALEAGMSCYPIPPELQGIVEMTPEYYRELSKART